MAKWIKFQGQVKAKKKRFLDIFTENSRYLAFGIFKNTRNVPGLFIV